MMNGSTSKIHSENPPNSLPKGAKSRNYFSMRFKGAESRFQEDKVKHIYFVAETKGNLESLELRKAEDLKIHCAREHFKAISSDSVKYEVIDNYKTLLDVVMS
jgi:type III restriction enzyme